MKFITSLTNALRGIKAVFQTEPNFRWQIFGLVLVIIAGIVFRISLSEWLWIMVAASLVLILELINTAIEKILDVVKPRLDDRVALIKDIVAGAVLLGALMALIIAAVLFIPRIIGQ